MIWIQPLVMFQINGFLCEFIFEFDFRSLINLLPVIEKWTSSHWKNDFRFKNDFRSFEDGGLADGMRCDSLGNIYVTRWGIGEIWKISPDGRLLRTIKTKGKNLTNVAFGGTDGKTIFVTVPDRGIIEYFRVEDPGIPLS